ncbi:hypothetical protein KJ766_00250, partial [Patescibacteria group bacterium]|nr:hypothetical protein [Patescibacteria group bacterium]
RVSTDFLNYGNTYYTITPPRIDVTCPGNDQFRIVGLTNVLPPETVSMDAKFSATAGAARKIYLQPIMPNLRGEPAYDIQSTGIYISAAGLRSSFGWLPIYGVSTDARAIRCGVDNTANQPSIFINGSISSL